MRLRHFRIVLLPLSLVLCAMNDSTFIVVLMIILAIHFALAVIVYLKISRKMKKQLRTSNNKYVAQNLKELEHYQWITFLFPIIGPIVGFGMANGVKPGILEKGYQANSDGKPDLGSEGD